MSTLILLRHGKSVWNGENAKFTGWCDVPLTVKGRVEAVAAGQLLRSRGFHANKIDHAFTSGLQRAHETCELSLASMAGPEQHTWPSERIVRCTGLNERHYGALQGQAKTNPDLLERFGADAVRSWRRTFEAAPPPLDETHPHYLPPPAPLTESLADCQKRALTCFDTLITPALFGSNDLQAPKAGNTVMVVAHSNTIRALMAHFDSVPSEAVPHLHVPNSVPILYRFNSQTRKLLSSQLQAKAGGSHARWVLSPENHFCVQAALRPGGMLTRALYDLCSSGWNCLLVTDNTCVLFARSVDNTFVLQPHLHFLPVPCVFFSVPFTLRHDSRHLHYQHHHHNHNHHYHYHHLRHHHPPSPSPLFTFLNQPPWQKSTTMCSQWPSSKLGCALW